MSEVANPIHPDVLPKLDEEFAAYYLANMANAPPLHEIPWNPAVRKGPPIPGSSQPVQVGLTKDFALSKFKVRVFWPEDPSKSPANGWPAFLFFHGGISLSMLLFQSLADLTRSMSRWMDARKFRYGKSFYNNRLLQLVPLLCLFLADGLDYVCIHQG